MNINFSRLFESIYTKILIITIIGVFGLIGGIKIGYALIQTTPAEVGWRLEPLTQAMLPKLDPIINIGNYFPPESYLDANGITGGFYQLLENKATHLVFVPVKLTWEDNEIISLKSKMDSLRIDDVPIILCTDFEDDNSWDNVRYILNFDLRVQCDIKSMIPGFGPDAGPCLYIIDSLGTVSNIVSMIDE